MPDESVIAGADYTDQTFGGIRIYAPLYYRSVTLGKALEAGTSRALAQPNPARPRTEKGKPCTA